MSMTNGPTKTIKVTKAKRLPCDYCDEAFEYYVNFFNHKIDTGYLPGYDLKAPVLTRRSCAYHLFKAMQEAYDKAYEHREKL